MSYLDERRKHIEAGRPLPDKKKHVIPKVGEKRQKKLNELKAAGTDSAMDIFFQSQRKRMTGRCIFCNNPTNKNDDEKFHFSIAHILPKACFGSVATHESNWIELCFWGENSCHTNLDNGKIEWLTIRDSKEWEAIAEKLHNILPAVAEEERKNKLFSKLSDLLYGK